MFGGKDVSQWGEKGKDFSKSKHKSFVQSKIFFDQSEYFFQSVKNILAGKSIKCEKTPHSFIEKSFIFAISSSLLWNQARKITPTLQIRFLPL